MSLFAQVLGVVTAGALVAGVLRPGTNARLRRGIVVASLALIGALAVSQLAESSRALDRIRAAHAGENEFFGRRQCAGDTGIDAAFADFVAARMPEGETFYLAMPSGLQAAGADLCVAMLLLPSLRVDTPERARHIVLWGVEPREVRPFIGRPGSSEKQFTPGHRLISLP